MIRPVVPGLGPDDTIRRSMVRISAHLALTRGRHLVLVADSACAGWRLWVDSWLCQGFLVRFLKARQHSRQNQRVSPLVSGPR